MTLMVSLWPDRNTMVPLRSVGADPVGVVAVVGGLGLCVAAALSVERIDAGPVICPFRIVTGLPCPGCGMTRAWTYAVHGRWTESVAANPFGLVAIAVVIGCWVALGLRALRRQRGIEGNRWDWNRIHRQPVVAGIAVAWLGFAAARMVAVGVGS